MTQNPFQPWKQNFSLPSQFYRKSDTDILTTIGKVKNGDAGASATSARPFELGSESQAYGMPVTSSSSSLGPPVDSDQPQTPKVSSNGAKFSIFSQLLNLNKINAFDNLLLNASMSLDDEELSSDKRQGIKKLMEQAIRLDQRAISFRRKKTKTIFSSSSRYHLFSLLLSSPSSDDAKQQISFILEKISSLRPAEKLLLYLKMPGGHSEVGEHSRQLSGKYLLDFPPNLLMERKTSDKPASRAKQSDKLSARRGSSCLAFAKSFLKVEEERTRT
jgi:hypothetical protein